MEYHPFAWQIPATRPWPPIPGTRKRWLNQLKEKKESLFEATTAITKLLKFLNQYAHWLEEPAKHSVVKFIKFAFK